MKSIINYFFKSYKFTSNIESFRVRTFLLFLLVGLLLLIAFTIKTALAGDYSSLPVQMTFLMLILTSLFLMKTGKHVIVGNGLSLIAILLEIASIFMNFSGAASYNFFVDEFYIVLALILFTAMFASRFVLYFNTIIVIAAAIIAFMYKKDSFPPEIIGELKFGLGVYIFVILLIFTFSYLYTSMIVKAIKEFNIDIELVAVGRKTDYYNEVANYVSKNDIKTF